MIQDDFGGWVHRECEADALYGEYHLRKPDDMDDDSADPRGMDDNQRAEDGLFDDTERNSGHNPYGY